MARDAQSAGDRVIAENYLQHAEHYYRIIAAAQAQMQERFPRDERSGRLQDRNDYRDSDRDQVMIMDQDEIDSTPDIDERPAPKQVAARSAIAPQPIVIDGSGPQPIIEGTPAEVAFDSDIPANDGNRERPAQRRRGAAARPRRQPRAAAGEGGGKDDGAAPHGGWRRPDAGHRTHLVRH